MIFAHKDPWEGFNIGVFSGASAPVDRAVIVSCLDVREAFAYTQELLQNPETYRVNVVVVVPNSQLPSPVTENISRLDEYRIFLSEIMTWARENDLRERFDGIHFLFDDLDRELCDHFFDHCEREQ